MNIQEAAGVVLNSAKSKYLSNFDKDIIKKMVNEGVLDFEDRPVNSYRLTKVVHFLYRIDENEAFNRMEIAKIFLAESEKVLDKDNKTSQIDLIKAVYTEEYLGDAEWGDRLISEMLADCGTDSSHLLDLMAMFINEGESDKGLEVARSIVGKAPNMYMAVTAANEVVDWLDDEQLAVSIVQKALDDKVESDGDDLDELYEEVKAKLKE